jgi:hypothetical protein
VVALAGVTRRSILELSHKWGEFKVSEKFVTMPELAKACQEKRVSPGASTQAQPVPVGGDGEVLVGTCVGCSRPSPDLLSPGRSFWKPSARGPRPWCPRSRPSCTRAR